jgi:hypothetical protein
VFYRNYAVNGGAVNIEGTSKVYFTQNVTSTHNFALFNGGGIQTQGDSKIEINSSTFTNNTSNEHASVLYFLGTDSNILTNSVISDNKAVKGNTIMMIFSDIFMNNVTIKNNIASSDSTGIYGAFSNITIMSSVFTNEKFPDNLVSASEASQAFSISGCFLTINSGCNIFIMSSNFSNGYASNGGAIYMSGSSNLFVESSLFDSCYAANTGGAFYASSIGEIQISATVLQSKHLG